ncbi:MAG: GAF domain-containing protein [Planctomycetes bacterium]|nr:GAF domain-containing protein [Planctomycetota bacterium]
MAKIVLGVGTSHSPMLSTPAEKWPEHVKRDLANTNLWAWDGKPHTYEEMVEMSPASIAQELTMDVWREKDAANQAADFRSVLKIVLEGVCAHTNWPVGHAYLPSEQNTELLLPSKVWFLSEPERFSTFRNVTEETSFEKGVGLPGRVLETGEPAWIIDVKRDKNFPRAKVASDIGVKGAFAFPVLVEDDVVAVLEFYSAESKEPEQPLLDVLADVGIQLGRVVGRERAQAEVRILNQELEERVHRRTAELEEANKDLADARDAALDPRQGLARGRDRDVRYGRVPRDASGARQPDYRRRHHRQHRLRAQPQAEIRRARRIRSGLRPERRFRRCRKDRRDDSRVGRAGGRPARRDHGLPRNRGGPVRTDLR